MNECDARALEILKELGGCPATPFFEERPARYIMATLSKMGVDHRRDEFGNIIAQHRHGADTSQPAIAFVAHMDHPGFEIIEASGNRVVARAQGGVPAAALVRPTPVLVISPDDVRVPATTTPHECTGDASDRRAERLVYLSLESNVDLSPPAPVVFDLPDFVLDEDTIRMRAVDDLSGCAAILAALEWTVESGVEAEVYGVFTRAEESGLLGARLMAETGTLPEDTVVVSVESSAVIPGVAQGEGPVIRTGDASYTFDAEAEDVLITARETLRKRDVDFKCQRNLLSGGVCEATAFAIFGYSVTGVAFPLGNYHNATTRIADLEGGVDAEYIRLFDYLGGLSLIAEAARSMARHHDVPTRRWPAEQVPEEVRRRLVESRGLK